MLGKCTECKYKSICRLDSRKRMHNGKCYIDELIERIKALPYKILDICYNIEADIGIEIYDITNKMKKPEWNWTFSSQPEKRNIINNMIRWYINHNGKCDKKYIAPPEKEIRQYIELILEICDCAFDTHRDGEMVTCLRCGELVPNNKKHNRKYCDYCKGYERLFTVRKICPDCGEEFEVDTPNNRQYRCEKCQMEADKAATRLRVQKYRERKECNGINLENSKKKKIREYHESFDEK